MITAQIFFPLNTREMIYHATDYQGSVPYLPLIAVPFCLLANSSSPRTMASSKINTIRIICNTTQFIEILRQPKDSNHATGVSTVPSYMLSNISSLAQIQLTRLCNNLLPWQRRIVPKYAFAKGTREFIKL